MVKVKICGICDSQGAQAAVEAGADMLGFHFCSSERRVTPEEAKSIVDGLAVKSTIVGVFIDQDPAEVREIAEFVGLDMLQLHGEEGPSFCAEAARASGARVIKAAQVAGPGDVRNLERFHVDFHLLDTRSRGREDLRGGTGETFDWNLLRARRSGVPLILSGGLSADNVAGAIALAHPYAVDTASGTEAAPGRKDPRRLREFFDAVAGGPSQPAAGEPLGLDRSTSGQPA